MTTKAILFSIGVVAFTSGCTTPATTTGAIKISPDTYLISATGYLSVPIGRVKKVVFDEATKFAESKGKVMIPISLKDSPPTFNQNATCELQFRVVDPSDPEVRRVSLEPRPDLVVQTNTKLTTESLGPDGRKPDLYSELTKLDDLRKKGILTEEEFAAQKKRLLESR